MKSMSRKTLKIVFVIYIIILWKVIVFKLPIWRMCEISQSWSRNVVFEGMESANFVLFKTIKMYIRYWGRGLNSFENLVGNVAVFIPFGYLFPRVIRSADNFFVWFLGIFTFVLSIEMFQLFSAFGAFDVDDILLNCSGALMGYFIFHFCRFFYRKKRKQNRITE